MYYVTSLEFTSVTQATDLANSQVLQKVHVIVMNNIHGDLKKPISACFNIFSSSVFRNRFNNIEYLF